MTTYREQNLVIATDGPQLTWEDRLFLAITTGGDYDVRGIPGFGATTAIALIQAGFGRSFTAILLSGLNETEPRPTYTTQMQAWIETLVKEVKYNTRRLLTRRNADLAASLASFLEHTEHFIKVGTLYVQPQSSWHCDHSGPPPTRPVHRPVNIAALRNICENYVGFGWSLRGRVNICEKFQNTVWEGVAVSILSSVSHDHI